MRRSGAFAEPEPAAVFNKQPKTRPPALGGARRGNGPKGEGHVKHRLRPGDHMPEFSYDTPYEPQNSFYALLEEDERPLFMIFLRNFGHPFTRHYIVRYAQTIQQLYSARLVCVVRTRPETIGPHLPKGTMPYPVICDAEGALYDYFEIPRVRGRMRTLSWDGMRILKDARRQGYEEPKGVPQQMPLTLLIAPGGEVLMAHYGTSVTDQPESCGAMEVVCQEMFHAAEQERKKAARKGRVQDGELADEEQAPSFPRPRKAPVEPVDDEDALLGELTLTGPDLPSRPAKPEPAPGRAAVPIRLNEPLDLGQKPPAPVSSPAPKPAAAPAAPILAAPPEKAQREAAKRSYTLWAAAGQKPATEAEPAGAVRRLPGETPAEEAEPAPAPKPVPAPAVPVDASSAAAPASAPKPTPAPAGPADASPAASAQKEDLPPVQPAITSPSGPAAEDIALQKFRSAAAALFSDEF